MEEYGAMDMIMELKGCIVSWGNFGHGATSVKNSLRNHFGRINNV